MKLVLTSDTHDGITKPGAIKRMFQNIKKKESFDVLVHAGDYSGRYTAAGAVRDTVSTAREVFGDVPFVTTLGNHDYWVRGEKDMRTWDYETPTLDAFMKNIAEIEEAFKKFNVWFLDNDGPFRKDGVTLFGHTGWYNHFNPPTNDWRFLPQNIEGASVHHWMNKRARDGFAANLDRLTPEDKKLVFVSHFSVVENDVPNDYGGSDSTGTFLQHEFGVKMFLNGHSHRRFDGPMHFECGSDYMNPAYMVVEV